MPSRRSHRWVGECFAATLTGGRRLGEGRPRRGSATSAQKGRWDDSTGHAFGGVGGFKQFQCDVATLRPSRPADSPVRVGQDPGGLELDQGPDSIEEAGGPRAVPLPHAGDGDRGVPRLRVLGARGRRRAC